MKWIMAIGAVLAIPALAFGAASYTLTAGGSGMSGATAVTIDPGDSFSIDLGITQEGTGVAAFDGALTASSNSTFYVTGRTWFLEGGANGENVYTPNWVNDTNKWLETSAHAGQNFGSVKPGSYAYWAASVFPSVTQTIDLDSSAIAEAGTYTISMGSAGGGIQIYDSDGVAKQETLTLGSYQVTITPEPASMLLLAGALPFLRRRRSA